MPGDEGLGVATLQLPVHSGMSEATLDWVAGRIVALARGHAERQRNP
jgi:hypothetical protein